MTDNPEAPDGWHWGIGSRSESYYTHWLYTNRVVYQDGLFGYEAEIYWDRGGEHHVNFYQYEKWVPNGDNVVSEYPTVSRSFDTEEKALEFAVDKATTLR